MIKGFFSKFGFSSDAKFFQKHAAALDNGFFIKLSTIGTILLAFGSALAGNYSFATEKKDGGAFNIITAIICHPILWMVVGAILTVLGAIGAYLDLKALKSKSEQFELEASKIPSLNDAVNNSQETIESLKSSLRELHTELVTTHLKATDKSLGLTTFDRVSIYYEHGNEFYLLARYSQNPEYAKSHRQKFALSQGVISKAWQHKTHVERHCPSFEKKAEYLHYMESSYGFKEAQALGFAMKSCRYIAVAISDADSHKGVIVFESTYPEFFGGSDGQIETLIYSYCQNYQGIHSKFLRDGLSLNRELHVKLAQTSVEKDIISSLKKGGAQ